MTVIAVKDGIVAADTMCKSGPMCNRLLPGFSKIRRLPDGSVMGGAGDLYDLLLMQEWMTGGMTEPRPKLKVAPDKDNSLLVVWAKTDGSIWVMDEQEGPMFQQKQAAMYASGEFGAAMFVEGAMAAGASAEEAIRLAIGCCHSVGGDVHTLKIG